MDVGAGGEAVKTTVPWSMVIVRALMGPGVVVLAMWGAAGWVLSLVVIAMLVDDIADGMVARRFGTDTPKLRLADSCADTVFYLGTAVAMWMRAPLALRENAWLIATLFALEGGRYVLDFAKFGKAASYHSYLAKAWGLALALAIVCVLARGGPVWMVTVAVGLGVVVNLEGVAMSLILPRWQNDVKTLVVARRIRADSAKEAVGGR
jgi:CDP-diacylglycerol--glycerol-3-phosphate 3-phosphatidyltransferase